MMRALVCLICAIAAGCTSVSPRERFTSVQDRTGQRVIWRTGSQEDAEADAAVHELLSRELSQDAAVQIALLNNRNLQATFEELRIAQAQLVRAGLLRNPVFQADVKFGESAGGEIVELAFMQTISELIRIPLRKRLAECEAEDAELRVSEAVLQLAGETRRGVIDLQALQQAIELRRTTLAVADASAEYAQALRDAGNITARDLADARAKHEKARLDLAAAEMQATAARERLNALMGLWGEVAAKWRVTEPLSDPPGDEMDLAALESTAIARNLSLANAKRRVTRAGESLRAAQPTALLEDLEIGAAAEREPDGTWFIGPAIGVPIPIFDQGQSAAAIALAEYNAARQRYIAVAVELRASSRTTAQQLRSAIERATHIRQVILPLREEALAAAEKQYNAMQIGTFQLLRARQDQIDSMMEYVQAVRDYWRARVEVDQLAIGAEVDAAPAKSPGEH